MAERIDCAVIGAGVVGLAIARRLAQAGREVVILEAEDAFGTHTSARNSEVIHGGIYYPTGSIKAKLCVTGKKALYRYCAEQNVNHQRIGKVIVATDETQLEGLKNTGNRARSTMSTISGGSNATSWPRSSRRCSAWPACCRLRPASSTATA